MTTPPTDPPRLSDMQLDLIHDRFMQSADNDEYPPLRLDLYHVVDVITQLRTSLAATQQELAAEKKRAEEALRELTSIQAAASEAVLEGDEEEMGDCLVEIEMRCKSARATLNTQGTADAGKGKTDE